MFLAAGSACLPVAAFAEMAPTPVMERTPHYTLSLTIGPIEAMVPVMEGMHGQAGNISSSPKSHDAGTLADQMDQGMAANHRLEAHITQVETGAVVMDVTPTIRITDKLSGTSRDLPQVMGMYGSSMGMSDFHYGQNVFLPEGAYLVKVLLGPSDTAEFRDVMVAASPMMMTDHADGPWRRHGARHGHGRRHRARRSNVQRGIRCNPSAVHLDLGRPRSAGVGQATQRGIGRSGRRVRGY